MTRYLTTLLAVVAFLLGMTIEESYGQYTAQNIVGYTQDFDTPTSGTTLQAGWTHKRSSNGYRTINSSPNTADQTSVDRRVTAYNASAPGWTPGNSEESFFCVNSSVSTDYALVFQRRPNSYSINLTVALKNNLAFPLTDVTLQYVIEKYGVGDNVNGTRIDLWYTILGTAGEVDVDTYDASGSPNTNPALGWVKVGSATREYNSDATNQNPGTGTSSYPLTQNPNSGTNTVGASIAFSPGIPVDGVLYLNWMFSFKKPVSQQGNNAQDGQEFGIDNFEIITATPVELISFAALYRNRTIELKWKTATEIDNYGFEIERSYDQKDWSKIDFVSGQGTVNTPTDYTYTDKSFDLSAPVVSYRLRQLDRDGSYDYSEVVTVAIEASPTISLRNFPNPFNPSTTISFNLKTNDVVTLTVYNELGQAVQRVLNNEALNAGSHAISFNGDNLPSGTYMYELRTSSGTTINKMILSK